MHTHSLTLTNELLIGVVNGEVAKGCGSSTHYTMGLIGQQVHKVGQTLCLADKRSALHSRLKNNTVTGNMSAETMALQTGNTRMYSTLLIQKCHSVIFKAHETTDDECIHPFHVDSRPLPCSTFKKKYMLLYMNVSAADLVDKHFLTLFESSTKAPNIPVHTHTDTGQQVLANPSQTVRFWTELAKATTDTGLVQVFNTHAGLQYSPASDKLSGSA